MNKEEMIKIRDKYKTTGHKIGILFIVEFALGIGLIFRAMDNAYTRGRYAMGERLANSYINDKDS